MKYCFNLTLLAFLFFGSSAFSQEFIAFEKAMNSNSMAASTQDTEGNYYLVGNGSSSYDYSPFYVSKLDSSGRILMEQPFELIEGRVHRPAGIIFTSSNEIVVFGAIDTGAGEGIQDFFICKFDREFNLKWKSIQEGEASFFNSVQGVELADESIGILFRKSFYQHSYEEYRDPEINLLIFDKQGDLSRQKAFGVHNQFEERAISIIKRDQELVLVYIEHQSLDYVVTYLLSLDQELNILDQKSIPGWKAADAILNSTKSLLLLGYSEKGGQVISLDAGFNIEKEKDIIVGKKITGIAEGEKQRYGISSYSYDDDLGFRLNILDAEFNLLVEKAYRRSSISGADVPKGILGTKDGGFLIYGLSIIPSIQLLQGGDIL